MYNPTDFTRDAAEMVARNDRRAWRRGLRRFVVARLRVVAVAWSALVMAAVVLWLLPMNARVA